jgi:hypothetical protein
MRGVRAETYWDDLEPHQKDSMLAELATRMLLENRLDLTVTEQETEDASPSVSSCLRTVMPSLGLAPRDADAAAKSIVLRSVVLTSVGDGSCAFIHRSFQDYLAAQNLVASGRLEELLTFVERSSQYHLLPFAAYRANTPDVERILRWTITKSNGPDSDTRTTILRLLECVAVARGVDPSLREESKALGAGLFPPRDIDEIPALAQLRDEAVEYLAPHLVPKESWPLCAELLARIGTTAAVSRLSEYCSSVDVALRSRLVDLWEQVPTELYAEMVLSRLGPKLDLKLSNPTLLTHTSSISNLHSLSLSRMRLAPSDVDHLLRADRLWELTASDCIFPIGWDRILTQGVARQVTLERPVGLREIACPINPKVSGLKVTHAVSGQLDLGTLLQDAKGLNVLWLEDLSGYVRAPDLRSIMFAKTEQLRTLILQTPIDAGDRDAFGTLRSLRRLEVSMQLGLGALSGLRNVAALRLLNCGFAGQSFIAKLDLSFLVDLVTIHIQGSSLDRPISWAPQVRQVSASTSSLGQSTFVSLPDTVSVLSLRDCQQLSMALDDQTFPQVRTLRIQGCGLQEISFARGFPNVQTVILESMVDLQDLAGVLAFNPDCVLVLSGTRHDFESRQLNRLLQRAGVTYERDESIQTYEVS